MSILLTDRDQRLQSMFEEMMTATLMAADPFEAVAALSTALAYTAQVHGMSHMQIMNSVDHSFKHAMGQTET